MERIKKLATEGRIKKFIEKAPFLIWHPFLFTSWFILFAAAHNIEETPAEVIKRPLLISLLTLAAVFIAAMLIFKSSRKIGIILTLLVLIIFGFGHIENFVDKLAGFVNLWGQNNGSRYILLGLLAILVVSAYMVIRSKGNFKQATKFLNVIALVLVAFNTFTLITKSEMEVSKSNSTDIKLEPKNGIKPDIYYIVPDHYMSRDVVRDQFNFDNKEFLDELRSSGFWVYDDARSNYQFTTPSLASTMNMRYLDKEVDANYGRSNSLVPLQTLIRNNEVVKNLKSLGYKYINIGSWWGPTHTSKYADINFDEAILYTVLNRDVVPTEFEHLLIGSSVLKPFMERGLSTGKFTLFKQKAIIGNDTVASALYQLEAVKQAVHSPGPKYTFLHLLVPHPDYVFDRDCSYPMSYPDNTEKKIKYVNQFQCASKMLSGTVDYILRNSPTDPVIIIQADEGMYPIEDKFDPKLVWWNLSDDDLKIKFSIIRALRMPGVDLSKYEGQDASVNTFRILFNEYFSGTYELLPDKSQVYKNESDRYNFRDITNRVNGR